MEISAILESYGLLIAIILIIHFLFSYGIYLFSKKLGFNNYHYSFVPIINLYYFSKIGGFSWVVFLLFLSL